MDLHDTLEWVRLRGWDDDVHGWWYINEHQTPDVQRYIFQHKLELWIDALGGPGVVADPPTRMWGYVAGFAANIYPPPMVEHGLSRRQQMILLIKEFQRQIEPIEEAWRTRLKEEQARAGDGVGLGEEQARAGDGVGLEEEQARASDGVGLEEEQLVPAMACPARSASHLPPSALLPPRSASHLPTSVLLPLATP